MIKKIFLVIASISFGASLFVILQLPDVVPVHWNASGQIDGYGSKWMDLILAILPLVIYVGMGFTRKIDPKKDKIEKRADVYEWFRIFTASIFIALNWAILYATVYEEFNLSILICLIMGIMLIVMGNYMPRIPQNYFLGFKVPWAIENEKVWYHTQRRGGIAFVISGIITIITGFIGNNVAYIIMLVVLLGSVLLVTVDSYFYFKKVTKNG